jgi:seryl-tRNA synthetase
VRPRSSPKPGSWVQTLTVPRNIVHNDIPVSNDEDNNKVLRTFTPEGMVVEKRACLSHHEVLHRLDAYDLPRGVKVSGHRGYFLKGFGWRL